MQQSMGATKTDYFTDKQNSTATLIKALGHPARVAILEYLMNKESCVCGELVEEIRLAQPTVSQHLRELKAAGIIKGSVEGNSICYCLDLDKVSELAAYFLEIKEKVQKQQNCCE